MTAKSIILLVLLSVVSQVLGQARLYSYICLSAEPKLCLGISTSTDPKYDPNNLLHLQVKLREKIEINQQDYLKTRWSVFPSIGQIQLANFTSLCLSKRIPNTATPGDAVLRPCNTQGDLEAWELQSFIRNETQGTQLRLRNALDQCLTLMMCQRTGDRCNKFPTKPFTNSEIKPDQHRGAYIKFMPCRDSSFVSQQFTQTIDCAPGCSPFMMEGGADNECNPECANDACNWDNGACATLRPTPPTMEPTKSPTKLPTNSPSKSPTTKSPTTAFPTANPASGPVESTRSPTTLRPSTTSSAPTTVSPTAAPSVIVIPPPSTTTITFSPTLNLTTDKSTEPVDDGGTNIGRKFWYVWLLIVLVVLLSMCIFFAWFSGAFRKKQKKEKPQKNLNDDDNLMGDDGDQEAGKMPPSPSSMMMTQEKRPQPEAMDNDMAIQDEPATKKTNVVDVPDDVPPVPAVGADVPHMDVSRS